MWKEVSGEYKKKQRKGRKKKAGWEGFTAEHCMSPQPTPRKISIQCNQAAQPVHLSTTLRIEKYLFYCSYLSAFIL